MITSLTEKQKAVLSFIVAFIQSQGYPPTGREIAENFGYTQTAAEQKLQALERKGAISRQPRIARSIVVL